MGFAHDQAARFERIHQIGNVPWRAPQNLAKLSLRPLRLMPQLPEEFSPAGRETPLRKARVHAGGQHHTELEQSLE
jgi:hypothetical protein